MIAFLSKNVKNGLILAKAARIASIARPAEKLTSHYGLQEDIHVDDFITSYMLKTCLMNLLPRHSQAEPCTCNEWWIWRTAEKWNSDDVKKTTHLATAHDDCDTDVKGTIGGPVISNDMYVADSRA